MTATMPEPLSIPVPSRSAASNNRRSDHRTRAHHTTIVAAAHLDRGQCCVDTQAARAPVEHLPGGQRSTDIQSTNAAGILLPFSGGQEQ